MARAFRVFAVAQRQSECGAKPVSARHQPVNIGGVRS
jgi:hypothetical protein